MLHGLDFLRLFIDNYTASSTRNDRLIVCLPGRAILACATHTPVICTLCTTDLMGPGNGRITERDLFEVGEKVDIVGTSKGRGFAGVTKRHGFRLGRKTHGSKSYRIPGSVGCSAWPSKIIRGKKMPGQYGNQRQTVRNLEIVDIRPDENLVMVKGAVPGHRNALVMVNKLKFQLRS